MKVFKVKQSLFGVITLFVLLTFLSCQKESIVDFNDLHLSDTITNHSDESSHHSGESDYHNSKSSHHNGESSHHNGESDYHNSKSSYHNGGSGHHNGGSGHHNGGSGHHNGIHDAKCNCDDIRHCSANCEVWQGTGEVIRVGGR